MQQDPPSHLALLPRIWADTCTATYSKEQTRQTSFAIKLRVAEEQTRSDLLSKTGKVTFESHAVTTNDSMRMRTVNGCGKQPENRPSFQDNNLLVLMHLLCPQQLPSPWSSPSRSFHEPGCHFGTRCRALLQCRAMVSERSGQAGPTGST